MDTTYLHLENGVGKQPHRIAQPLAGDWSAQLGWFRFYFDDDRWVWSPQVERMHGYKPGTTSPSTLLLLSHVDLDDYQKVAATLYDARRKHRPFSSHHRIIDTGHHTHDVVMVGAPFYAADGALLGTHGFWLDATPLTQARAANPVTRAADRERAEHRQQRIRAATQC